MKKFKVNRNTYLIRKHFIGCENENIQLITTWTAHLTRINVMNDYPAEAEIMVYNYQKRQGMIMTDADTIYQNIKITLEKYTKIKENCSKKDVALAKGLLAVLKKTHMEYNDTFIDFSKSYLQAAYIVNNHAFKKGGILAKGLKSEIMKSRNLTFFTQVKHRLFNILPQVTETPGTSPIFEDITLLLYKNYKEPTDFDTDEFTKEDIHQVKYYLLGIGEKIGVFKISAESQTADNEKGVELRNKK